MLKTLPAVAAAAVSCLMGGIALAQTQATPETSAASPSAQVAAAPTPDPAPSVVPNGTPIVVEFTDLVTTRTANRDDFFGLKLAEPILLNGVVVIPSGTPGKGQVVDMGRPGMAGKPGKLVLAGRYLDLNGKQIPIRGLKMAMVGHSNTETAAVATIAVGIFGLAVTGGHMEVPVGTRAVAKLGADFAPDAAAVPPAAAPTPAVQPTDPASAPKTNP